MYTTGLSVGKHVLPVGKWKGRALGEIDSGYLQWVLREWKLSTGLRSAVEGELRRRGIEPPAAAPPPKPLPPCRCGSADLRLLWHEFRDGRRQVRRECAGCGACRGFAPQLPEFVAEADRNAPGARRGRQGGLMDAPN
jgi:hypothetical protein